MTDQTPEDQALDARYRELAARTASAPAQATRRAILAQARAQAAVRARGTLRPRAATPWARPALFGALAASVVAGLIVLPRWWRPLDAPAPLAARVTPAAPAETLVQITPAAPAGTPLQKAAPAPLPATLAEVRPENLPAPSLDSLPKTPARAQDAARAPAAMGGMVANPRSAIANTTTTRVAAAPVPLLPGAELRHAAELGDLAQLEALSRGQPDLNARDALGRTALLLATVNGHANAVAALMAYGADARVADAQGVTPLAAARAAGNAEIVAIFARYGLR
jgi:hypothetical protein